MGAASNNAVKSHHQILICSYPTALISLLALRRFGTTSCIFRADLNVIFRSLSDLASNCGAFANERKTCIRVKIKLGQIWKKEHMKCMTFYCDETATSEIAEQCN